MPPRTDCSASRSCGGTRSKPGDPPSQPLLSRPRSCCSPRSRLSPRRWRETGRRSLGPVSVQGSSKGSGILTGHLLPSAPRTLAVPLLLTAQHRQSRRSTPVPSRRVLWDSRAETGCGRRSTVGGPAPSANLVIHRACGRRTRCCGELRRTCARSGGQHCGQTHNAAMITVLTWPFSIHGLWGRKTFRLGTRSRQTTCRRTQRASKCKDHFCLASVTCGRLDCAHDPGSGDLALQPSTA